MTLDPDSNSVLPNQEPIDSVTPHAEANQESGQPPVDPPLGPNIQPSPEHTKPSEECRPDQTPIGKYVLEVLAAGILASYTFAAFQQLGAMSGQLTEMRTSNSNTDRQIILGMGQLAVASRNAKSAEDTLSQMKTQAEIESRPWVAIDTAPDKGIVPYGDLTFATSGVSGSSVGAVSDSSIVTAPEGAIFANFALRYSIKNFGRSPANVYISTDILNKGYPRHTPQWVIEVEKFCDKNEKMSLSPHGWPATIVPGEANLSFRRKLQIQKDTLEIKPTVIGCIWYRSTIGKDEKIHRTPFSGNISMKEDVNHNPADDINPIAIPVSVGKTPPANRMKVVDVWMVGTAD
jgi:hypothetical protein